MLIIIVVDVVKCLRSTLEAWHYVTHIKLNIEMEQAKVRLRIVTKFKTSIVKNNDQNLKEIDLYK